MNYSCLYVDRNTVTERAALLTCPGRVQISGAVVTGVSQLPSPFPTSHLTSRSRVAPAVPAASLQRGRKVVLGPQLSLSSLGSHYPGLGAAPCQAK